ncbi:MAG: hypothetical protein ACMUIG_06875 [Thermoplasmatota archaeon]
MENDLKHLSRYPFLEEAREWVGSQGLSMEYMLSDEMSPVHDLASRRVEEAVDGVEINRSPAVEMGDYRSDLLSYPISRFMVASTGDSTLVKWFSHHEGMRAHFFLEDEDTDTILMIGERLGLPALENPPDYQQERTTIPRVTKGFRPGGDGMEGERRSYWVRFSAYLPPKGHISGPDWDLTNQRMVKGYIELNRSKYIRLLQELIRKRVEEGLYDRASIPKGSPLEARVAAIKAKVANRKKTYSPSELGKMSITRLPPCMRQILGMSQAGENMPHHARFALVTFLSNIGMKYEEIFNVFRGAPDFKESVVRYQIEHITGVTSATEYSVPGCDTMKTGGICYNPDSLCEQEWMGHPLTYYRVKGKKKGGGRKKGATSRDSSA